VTSRALHAVLLPGGTATGPFLAALAAALDGTGPALLPLDASLPRARLTALIEAFRPSAVLDSDARMAHRGAPSTLDGTSSRVLGPLDGTSSRVLGPLDGTSSRGGDGVPPEVAVVIATSGSTGPPKGTQLSAAALLASAHASLRRIGAAPGQRWLCCLPVSHVAGLQVLVRSLLAGAEPAVLTGRLTAAAVAASGCAYASLVPAQLRRLTDDGAGLGGLEAILLGGSAVPPGLLDAARAAGGRVLTTYGMSETCGGCVYDGQPLDGVQVAVGGDGRIRISGPVLFSGYRRRPDLTAAATDGRWFVTSDLGSVGPDGRLTVRGRADGMIISGGENVAADEVAAVLAGCPGVREAAVVGCPDPEWGELVTAVVVAQDPARPPELAALREAVRAVLPAAAAPRALVLVAALPLLASGKPDRLAMTALAARQMNGTGPGNR
jgi:o-succinylbenzoate---CoA ligase